MEVVFVNSFLCPYSFQRYVFAKEMAVCGLQVLHTEESEPDHHLYWNSFNGEVGDVLKRAIEL